MDISFLGEAFFIALSGVPMTLLVTVVVLVIALPISFFLAYIRVSEWPVIKQFITIYVSFVRGTPVIVQIFVIYSSMPIILNGIFTSRNIDWNVYDIHPIWYAFVIFTFHMIAVLIEVFRSALTSVDRGQIEASEAVGMTTWQAYRRIIIPQVLVVALPNLNNATIHLIKATSLGYAISLYEITLKTKVAANAGYHYLEAYIDIFIVYMIICIAVEQLLKWVERRLSKWHPA